MNHRNRHSIRLAGYDYSQDGAYFITICTQNRECLFGDVLNGAMILNEVGMIVQDEWLRAEILRQYVSLDSFIVMPNHIHGIIIFDGAQLGTSLALNQGTPPQPDQGTSPQPDQGTSPPCPYESGFGRAVAHSLPTVIGQFKSITTKRLNTKSNMPGTKIWQRNYYDHIIRNDEDLKRIQEYIINNPQQWAYDSENPSQK